MAVAEHVLVDQLFEKLRRQMVARARLVTGCNEDAEDLVQECFLRLSQQSGLALVDAPEAFAWTILRNLTVANYREKLRAVKTAVGGGQSEEEGEPIPGPTLGAIDACLDVLNLRHRRLLTLAAEGLSTAAIAIAEGSSAHVVSSALARARQNFRRELLRRGLVG